MSTTSNPPTTDASDAKLPRVTIVGRPNVGKSTLLNRMANSRISIVEPTAGVTRDRISVPVRLRTSDGDVWIEVIDTGGIGIVDRDDLGPHVEQQVQAALAGSDLILFMVDARDGLTPLDREVASRLRGHSIPVMLLVNKVEGEKLTWEVDAFRQLGLAAEPMAVSAQNGNGMADLYDAIAERLPLLVSERPERHSAMKLAVVGRRNAGKSTLINALAREDRMIVSEVPGTTRDAVDVLFERDGEYFVAIDTAGVRKRSRHADAIEFFSDVRSKKSIRRADVVLLMFDVTQEIAALDKTLARYVVDHHKPLILGANKWDLVQDREPDDFRDYLDRELPGVSYSPVVFMSAKGSMQVDETLNVARSLYEQAGKRVGTGELNRVLERALQARSPSSSGYRVRVRYATQAEVHPPTFVLFVNDTRLIGKAYLRYLENRLREELGFEEIPVRILLRDKDSGPVEEEREWSRSGLRDRYRNRRATEVTDPDDGSDEL